MPRYCEPCPGKRNAMRPRALPSPRKTPRCRARRSPRPVSSTFAARDRPSANPPWPLDGSTADGSKAIATRWGSSASAPSGRSRSRFTVGSSRASRNACTRANSAWRLAAPRTTTPPMASQPRLSFRGSGSTDADSSAGAASSRTAWTLAPPKPKALTPTRRGTPAGTAHASVRVWMVRLASLRGSAGFRVVTPRVGTRRW